MDKIRVMRVLIYEGDRDVIESHLASTIQGTKIIPPSGPRKGYKITAQTIDQFPEILKQHENETNLTKENI